MRGRKVRAGAACVVAASIGVCLSSGEAVARVGSAEELAKKLANPISSLISIPLQFNYDSGIGPTGWGARAGFTILPPSRN